MIEEVVPNIYRIEVGLPQNPLRSINAYFIRDAKRSVLIDTGMNRPECLADLCGALDELGVDMKHADLFITHVHADHTGLLAYFRNGSTRFLCSEPDSVSINNMIEAATWDWMRAAAVQHGFEPQEAFDAVELHPARRYCNKEKIDFTIVREGDRLEAGGYSFEMIATPGHSDGHICLYDAEHKLFISGDHVLYDISPTIMQWDPDGTPLKNYFASLRKVYPLDVALVLPGHRGTFTPFKERIDELIAHHEARLEEIEATLTELPQSSLQIASQVSWHIKIKSFADFPPQQKLFACGEVLAHLTMLAEQGKVQRVDQGGKTFFSRR